MGPENHFHWGPVTSHSIHITWDSHERIGPPDTLITVTAELASSPRSEKSISVPLERGEVTVDGLMPHSLYIVTVMEMGGGEQLLQFRKAVKTLASGKIPHAIML